MGLTRCYKTAVFYIYTYRDKSDSVSQDRLIKISIFILEAPLGFNISIYVFVRTNILIRKFSKCTDAVKIVLFKAYCICLYDASLWKRYNVSALNKLRSCYNRCIKLFLGLNVVTVSQVFLWILVYLALTLYWLMPHSLLCICGVRVIIT